MSKTIETERVRLVEWDDRHLAAFISLHADPEVMADLGGPVDREESRRKFDRYRAALSEHGVSRWAVENKNGIFLGYAGVMPRMSPDHPLGRHFEIGWRLSRIAWGSGYATESARAALNHAVDVVGLTEILSYTSAENSRSQAVIAKLGLRRRPSLDFVLENQKVGHWRGMVWSFAAKSSD
jgi:RimJ/RimL family protein N-acetyltransferase